MVGVKVGSNRLYNTGRRQMCIETLEEQWPELEEGGDTKESCMDRNGGLKRKGGKKNTPKPHLLG